MRRSNWIVTLTLTLALLASPVTLAFYDIVQDRPGSGNGPGVAVVHVVDNIFAKVWYEDTNNDGVYSEGDLRLRIILFRQ
jgi:hypothetical protein